MSNSFKLYSTFLANLFFFLSFSLQSLEYDSCLTKHFFSSVGTYQTAHPGHHLLYFCVGLSTVGYFLFLEFLSSLGFCDLLSLGFYPVSPVAPVLSCLLTFLLPTPQGSVVTQSPVLSTLEFSLFPLRSPLLSWIQPSSLHCHDLLV